MVCNIGDISGSGPFLAQGPFYENLTPNPKCLAPPLEETVLHNRSTCRSILLSLDVMSNHP